MSSERSTPRIMARGGRPLDRGRCAPAPAPPASTPERNRGQVKPRRVLVLLAVIVFATLMFGVGSAVEKASAGTTALWPTRGHRVEKPEARRRLQQQPTTRKRSLVSTQNKYR